MIEQGWSEGLKIVEKSDYGAGPFRVVNSRGWIFASTETRAEADAALADLQLLAQWWDRGYKWDGGSR